MLSDLVVETNNAHFLDVGRDFIKVHSRITTKVNVFPVVEENQNNPRLHKK